MAIEDPRTLEAIRPLPLPRTRRITLLGVSLIVKENLSTIIIKKKDISPIITRRRTLR